MRVPSPMIIARLKSFGGSIGEDGGMISRGKKAHHREYSRLDWGYTHGCYVSTEWQADILCDRAGRSHTGHCPHAMGSCTPKNLGTVRIECHERGIQKKKGFTHGTGSIILMHETGSRYRPERDRTLSVVRAFDVALTLKLEAPKYDCVRVRSHGTLSTSIYTADREAGGIDQEFPRVGPGFVCRFT
jgi:hypothetical protein